MTAVQAAHHGTDTDADHQHQHHDQHSRDQHGQHGQHGHDQHSRDLVESYAHVQGGPTVLDIGGDIGALVATMDPSAVGTELHLRSGHQPPIEIHTGVWHRGSGTNGAVTAVFAELLAGTYWVLDEGGTPRQQVLVQGGELARVDLRNSSHPIHPA